MESRKIQVTGGSSFMITLPKDWVEESGLGKNDTVYLEPDGNGNMMLMSNESGCQSAERGKVIEVRPEQGTEFVQRALVGAYVAGYTEITLHCSGTVPAGFRDASREFARTAVGMETISESSDSVTMRNLMDPAEVRPLVGIERMKMLAKNLLSDAVDAIVSGTGLESLEGRDNDIDRVDWFIARQTHVMQSIPSLYTKLGVSAADMTEYHLVARLIESIADHTVTINDCISYIADPIEMQSLGAVIEDLGLPGLFEDCVNSFTDRDAEAANECINRCSETVQRIRGVLELGSIMDDKTATAAALVSGNIKRILRYFADISEAAIDSAMRNRGEHDA